MDENEVLDHTPAESLQELEKLKEQIREEGKSAS